MEPLENDFYSLHDLDGCVFVFIFENLLGHCACSGVKEMFFYALIIRNYLDGRKLLLAHWTKVW